MAGREKSSEHSPTPLRARYAYSKLIICNIVEHVVNNKAVAAKAGLLTGENRKIIVSVSM